uniref:ATP-binding cassette domain-containing protein n=1 Tax=candidate division WOR-3 bacterium TaxID=2052148 RepID=A0A7C4CAD6_UNCW3
MIEVRKVSKMLAGMAVLEDVDFVVPDSGGVVILGRTGAGKSVLLRVMAGLLAPDSGVVAFDGRLLEFGPLADNSEAMEQLGYVFQGGALFDWLSVVENVALPLMESRRTGRRKAVEAAQRVLWRVGLADAAGFRPRELSGGMTKLAAIARALVADPKYVFYDEPTAGLDPITRDRVCGLIRELRDTESRASVVVTHDLETVRRLGGQVFMLRRGRLLPVSDVRKEDYEPECA